MLSQDKRALNKFGVKPRLLIVDDNPIEAQVLQHTLSSEFNVEYALSAQDARIYLASNQVDLILLDIVMPDIDGISLCSELQQDDTLCDIPVVFLTGTARHFSEERCWSAGCADFLIKPVSRQNLLARLKLHIAMKKRADEFQHQTKWYSDQKLVHAEWYFNFLEKQCYKANMGQTPMSLLVMQVANYEDIVIHSDPRAVDSHLTNIAALITESLHRSIDVVVKYKKDRFLCILPDSGPESTRHFAFLVTQAIAKANQVCNRDKTIPVDLRIAGITQFKTRIEAKSLVAQVESCLDENRELIPISGFFQAKHTTRFGGLEQTLFATAI